MKKTSIKNAEYQRAEKGLTQCCKVSVSHQDVSRAAELHRSHTDFTFNSLSRIEQEKGFKVNTLILICSTEKT